MKNFALTLIALFVSLACLSNVAIAGVVVASERTDYSNSERVQFTIRNETLKDVNVYVTLEVMDNHGSWSAWDFSVEDGTPRAIPKKNTLKPGKCLKSYFDIKKSKFLPLPNGITPKYPQSLTFRFRYVFYSVSTDKKLGEDVSGSFVMKQPFAFKNPD